MVTHRLDCIFLGDPGDHTIEYIGKEGVHILICPQCGSFEEVKE